MTQKKELTLEDLTTILKAAAGAAERVDLGGDILDVEFADLGYDSLALMETGSRIERQFGVRLDEATVRSALWSTRAWPARREATASSPRGQQPRTPAGRSAASSRPARARAPPGVLKDDGEPVEHGEPLFALATTEHA